MWLVDGHGEASYSSPLDHAQGDLGAFVIDDCEVPRHDWPLGDWKAVASSYINAVSYADETGDLGIEFTDGAQWAYSGVPRDVYDDLMRAPSVGKYFLGWAKGRFNGEKMD